jgi:hypothetical protein
MIKVNWDRNISFYYKSDIIANILFFYYNDIKVKRWKR